MWDGIKNRLAIVRRGLILSLFVSGICQALSCEPRDLRNPKVAPARNQTYSYQGKIMDSGFCYAFSLANLVGQVLGEAIAPEDIAYQYWFTYWWEKLGKDSPFPNAFMASYPYAGGFVEYAFDAMPPEGYCRASQFDNSLNHLGPARDWYNNLKVESEKVSVADFHSKINSVCESRIPFQRNFELKSNHISYDKLSEKSSDPESLIDQLITQIETNLRVGRYTVLSYASHYVTIVGKDRGCNYIVQDSIPASLREANGYPKYYNSVENEYFQFWSRQSLLKALMKETWLEFLHLE